MSCSHFVPDQRLFHLCKQRFRQVIDLPEDVPSWSVLDLTKPPATGEIIADWTVGKYDEKREGMYNTELFSVLDPSLRRNIHIGIDLGAPVNQPVLSFATGSVHSCGYNPAPGDYGNVVVVEYVFGKDGVARDVDGQDDDEEDLTHLWALYGHLNSKTLETLYAGKHVKEGETIGWIGDRKENGGWEPHLHFQLSVKEPATHDMPGVVAEKDIKQARLDFPHPFHVTGVLY